MRLSYGEAHTRFSAVLRGGKSGYAAAGTTVHSHADCYAAVEMFALSATQLGGSSST
jgi:hypothetical protein